MTLLCLYTYLYVLLFLALPVRLVHSIIDLPFGDFNVLVVTDVHSWVGGHGRHEPATLDADYGDVLSFYQRLKAKRKDLLLVMNGDFVDGTGLSTIPPKALTRIEEHMPFDAVNVGNHELYHNETVRYLLDGGFIDHWKGNFLSSNTLLASSRQPLGHRYTYLYANDKTILTLGFLYNMTNPCSLIVVQSVQETVQEAWFQQTLLNPNYDAILVLAHMDAVDPLVFVLLKAIRTLIGNDMPIQFITGHTHRRAAVQLDGTASTVEAGRFFDTIGFVSFPSIQSVRKTRRNVSNLFQHVFLDANKRDLLQALGRENDKLQTQDGIALSARIESEQEKLGLTEVLGCSPSTFSLQAPMEDPLSLWRLYMHIVIPTQLFKYNDSKLFVQGKYALRYSLFAGNVTLDDVIAVCPFNDTIYEIVDSISGADLMVAFANTTEQQPSELVLSAVAVTPNKQYALYAPEWELNRVLSLLPSGREYHPFPVCNQTSSTCKYTTNLWRNFVREEWPCDHAHHRAPRWIPTTVFVSVMAFLFGLWFLAERSRRRQKEESSALLSGTIDRLEEGSNNYGAI